MDRVRRSPPVPALTLTPRSSPVVRQLDRFRNCRRPHSVLRLSTDGYFTRPILIHTRISFPESGDRIRDECPHAAPVVSPPHPHINRSQHSTRTLCMCTLGHCALVDTSSIPRAWLRLLWGGGASLHAVGTARTVAEASLAAGRFRGGVSVCLFCFPRRAPLPSFFPLPSRNPWYSI